jgi:hypothetical protein
MLALVVFALTNFTVQTHVHLLPAAAAPNTVSAAGVRLERIPAPQKTNPFDNPATCPLCQDMVFAGHFTTPAVIPVLPPALIALPATIAVAMPAYITAVSHIWRGRAPPKH